MQRAYAKISGQMPDVKPVTVSAATPSIFKRFYLPQTAQAITNPFTGNITYDPEANMGRSQTDLENTIAHELTHSRQAQNTPWYQTLYDAIRPDEKVPEGIGQNSPLNNPYYWRTPELEAFQTEKDRERLQSGQVDPITGNRDIPLYTPDPRYAPKQPGIDTAPSQLKRRP